MHLIMQEVSDTYNASLSKYMFYTRKRIWKEYIPIQIILQSSNVSIYAGLYYSMNQLDGTKKQHKWLYMMIKYDTVSYFSLR